DVHHPSGFVTEQHERRFSAVSLPPPGCRVVPQLVRVPRVFTTPCTHLVALFLREPPPPILSRLVFPLCQRFGRRKCILARALDRTAVAGDGVAFTLRAASAATHAVRARFVALVHRCLARSMKRDESLHFGCCGG